MLRRCKCSHSKCENWKGALESKLPIHRTDESSYRQNRHLYAQHLIVDLKLHHKWHLGNRGHREMWGPFWAVYTWEWRRDLWRKADRQIHVDYWQLLHCIQLPSTHTHLCTFVYRRSTHLFLPSLCTFVILSLTYASLVFLLTFHLKTSFFLDSQLVVIMLHTCVRMPNTEATFHRDVQRLALSFSLNVLSHIPFPNWWNLQWPLFLLLFLP